jgi:phenylacetate-CoA ligase
MTAMTAEDRQQIMSLDRDELRSFQLAKLNQLLGQILPQNEFYRQKLAGNPAAISGFDELQSLPLTTKEELQPAPSRGPFASNLTFPAERYVRFHQTSGTHGRPLVVLDTADDWRWWMEAWQFVLDAAEITAHDRALLAFSFGPFIGFWSAFDALVARGVLVVPGGGLSSLARLEMIRQMNVSALFCTPTYALRLAEVAAAESIDLVKSSVEKIVVAGEPGGSIPATRQRIESAWGAPLVDHGGATEVGPWGFADADGQGLHVNEAHFLPEFISVTTGHAAGEGELSHLVLTTLGRAGSPVIRYRTGDLVRPSWLPNSPNRFVFLKGGILGRADEMMIIRGVNIFPTAIEEILHGFPEVVEHRLTARKHGAMDDLLVEVEDHLHEPKRIARELQLRLGLKIEVRCVEPLSLPRFDGKGRRFVDER